jgi:hypothetical protein
MDWNIVLGVVVSGVILIACWGVVTVIKERKSGGSSMWAILDYAKYAVMAAREVTGANTNAEIGIRAEALLRSKFPKAPDFDIDVAIGSALDALEAKPVPPTVPIVDPGLDSSDILT